MPLIFAEPFLQTKILWEPRGLWVGVYWTYNSMAYTMMVGDLLFGGKNWHKHLRLYVCILPCLPFRLDFRWGFKKS